MLQTHTHTHTHKSTVGECAMTLKPTLKHTLVKNLYPRRAAVAEETCSWSKPSVWFQDGLLSAVGSEPWTAIAHTHTCTHSYFAIWTLTDNTYSGLPRLRLIPPLEKQKDMQFIFC